MDARKRRVARNKKKTVLRLLMLFGILLIVIAGIIAAVFLLGRSAVPQVAFVEMGFGASDSHVYTGSGFLYARGNMLYNDDLINDKNDYALQITSGDFKLAGSPTMGLLYNTGNIKIIGTGKDTPTIEMRGSVRSVKCGTSYIAALRKDEAGEERILVYDVASGAQQEPVKSTGEYIVDYGFFTAESEYLYVLSLSLSASMPVCMIDVYNVTNRTITSVMAVQNQLIERIYFTKNSIFAIGTNQVIRYPLLEPANKDYRVTVYGFALLDFDANGSGAAFLLHPRSSDALGTVKLLQLTEASVPAEKQQMLQLPSGTIGAFVMGGKLIAVRPGGYTQFDMNGKQVAEYKFPTNIEQAQKLDSKSLLLRAGNTMYTLNIN